MKNFNHDRQDVFYHGAEEMKKPTPKEEAEGKRMRAKADREIAAEKRKAPSAKEQAAEKQREQDKKYFGNSKQLAPPPPSSGSAFGGFEETSPSALEARDRMIFRQEQRNIDRSNSNARRDPGGRKR